ncbi:hypothetical protein A2U01_0093086, partial [Trifolium medium]|nr:hypothetical protein [Trifolium medium]
MAGLAGDLAKGAEEFMVSGEQNSRKTKANEGDSFPTTHV